jgi:hypothetical protein
MQPSPHDWAGVFFQTVTILDTGIFALRLRTLRGREAPDATAFLR